MVTPLPFDQAVADEICERISKGQSLRSICEVPRDDFIPASSTVFKWLASTPTFAEQYARAREAQADALFDEILDIADDSRNDFMERQLGEDGPTVAVVDHENIARAKLRVDARKWMAGKLRPKVYGEKIDIEHSGVIDVRGVLLDMK